MMLSNPVTRESSSIRQTSKLNATRKGIVRCHATACHGEIKNGNGNRRLTTACTKYAVLHRQNPRNPRVLHSTASAAYAKLEFSLCLALPAIDLNDNLEYFWANLLPPD